MLIQERKQAWTQNDMATARIKTKAIKRAVRQDRRDALLAIVDKDLDIRDLWQGIRFLKTGKDPLSLNIKGATGGEIALKTKAREAATFLATHVWGKPGIATTHTDPYKPPISDAAPIIETSDITMSELMAAIRRLKRGKAPGPDEIPMEFYKELQETNLEHILELLNEWWAEEEVPTQVLQARVVLIFKKGDRADLANYRPISLLNSICKLLAAIIPTRLAKWLNEILRPTQYGFRKKRGTADAIQYVVE